MKSDNQHLDFLISQYVDGCLEGAGKKSVEQQMLNDPSARKLYTEHREVQDLLDDWGNRIPLIDWDDFDQKLATRLEQETVGEKRQDGWRRWVKPLAAAAALFIAASLGYSWNAWMSPKPVTPIAVVTPGAQPGSRTYVTIEGMGRSTQPSQSNVFINDATSNALPANTMVAGAGTVEVTPPENSDATESLRDSLKIGFGNLTDSMKQQGLTGASNVAVTLPVKDDKETAPAFP